MPGYLAPALMFAIAGILISVGGLLGPETKDVDMSRDDTAAPVGTAA